MGIGIKGNGIDLGVLPDDKGLIETLNDFYDGAINEADLTDIIKNIQNENTTKA